MKMRVFLTLSACLFSFTISNAQDPIPYLCMEPGTLLTYESYDGTDGSTDRTTVKIDKIEQRGRDTYVISTEKSYNGEGKLISENNSKTSYFSNGVTYFIEDMSDELDIEQEHKGKISLSPMIIDIDSRWTPGKKPKDKAMEMKADGIKISLVLANRKYHGKEKVKTPAGEFECMKMTADIKSKVGIIGMKIATQTDWYAPGIGLVKSEMKEGKKLIDRTELQSISR